MNNEYLENEDTLLNIVNTLTLADLKLVLLIVPSFKDPNKLMGWAFFTKNLLFFNQIGQLS